MIYSLEVAKLLGQSFCHNGVFFGSERMFVVDAWWIEDIAELTDDIIRPPHTLHLSFVDKGDAVALAYLVHIRCRGDDGDTVLALQFLQHLPELLAGDGVDTRSRLVEE